MIVNHKIYGQMEVDEAELNSSAPFIRAKHITRSGMPDMTVGKAALDNKGGYTPKKRNDPERVVKYLPLVYSAASKFLREEDDYEELWCEGALGLVEADRRYDERNPAAFASFAKPYVSGYILKARDSRRNGTHDTVQLDDTLHESDEASAERKLMIGRAYEAFDTLTPKQKFVMEGLYVYGYTQEAIADKMGVSQVAVHHLEAKATVAIRKHLGTE